MTATSIDGYPTLLLRAAALALGALFLLPSCFTFAVWREGNRSQGQPESVDALLTTSAGAPRILCHWKAWRGPGFEDLRSLWRPPLTPGTWLEVELLEHAETAARLWREMPADCGLQLVRGDDDATAPVCQFVYPASVFFAPGSLPDGFDGWPGVRVRAGAYGVKRLVFEAACRVAPVPAPADVPTSTIALQPCRPPWSTGERLLATPLTLAIDAVLLPFELIGISDWW